MKIKEKELERFMPETAKAFELQWSERNHPLGYLSRGMMYIAALYNAFWLMDLIGMLNEDFLDELDYVNGQEKIEG